MSILESSSIIMLLLCLVDFANSFPSSFIQPSVRVNEFIKHYEAAFYDAEEITNQHRRNKRKTDGIGEKSNAAAAAAPLKLTISTSNRIFKLLLTPDRDLFAEDVEFEGSKGRKIEFDPGSAYVGTLEDDERAKVRGIITKEGLFDGTITTHLEEFYVEPLSRYKDRVDKDDDTHTIVYKISDVVHPTSPLCAISNSETKHKPTDLNTIAHRSKRRERRRAGGDPPYENEDNSFRRTPAHHSESSFLRHFNDELEKLTPPAVAAEDAHHQRQSSSDHGWPKFRNLFLTQNRKSDSDSFVPPSSSDKRERSSLSALLHAQRTTSGPVLASSGSGGTFYDLDLVNMSPELNVAGKKGHDDDNTRNYEFNDDQLTAFRPTNNTGAGVLESSSKHWRPKTGLIDTVYKYTNATKGAKGYLPPSGIIHKSNPKILIGSGGGGGADESHANLIITSDDSLEQHARKRVMVDPKKTTCMLYLQADHLFFDKYGTEETCIEVMTRHVQRVNSIYRNTDFNQDGKSDNISFMIKRIKVHSLNDSSYRFPGNYGVEKFLEIFSEEDYDAFCLAYMFTYRDFEMGTLGLAWTGDLKNAGGVCEKNGHYRGSMKSLNTGIVTVLNYGKHVPSAVSHVTLAHEIGHNFGSPHDPDGCTPGGDDGNFIMFARATSGDKKNNNKFSPCSLHAINPVLNAKARSSKGCFTEPQTSICGNGVVEPGEECDCGWEEDCRDSCCYPQSRYQRLDETPCRLTPNALCSPSQGPCCSTTCQLKFGDMCRSDNGCRDSSFCNGSSPQCPASINKPNKTVCNEEFVCYMGECTGSICLAYGLESCQCIPTPSDLDTKACELCCKLPGENQPCLSSFQWNQVPYDVPDMFAKPGTPCNNYNGYCDVFRKCREVDPSGPIATLRKLLLSEENIASFKKWALDHWYYCGLIFLSFLLLMLFSTKILGKKPKVKAVTVVHSSTTETVRLPADGGNGPPIVVHPIVVRSKLPFKKKVHEKKRRAKGALPSKNEDSVPHNVNNNNSPVEAKKKTAAAKKRTEVKANAKPAKSKEPKSTVVAAAAAPKDSANVSEDPLGKVRNWLLQSHNIDGFGSLKKSKSSPAGFDLSDPTAAAAAAAKKQRPQRTTPTTAAAATVANANASAVPAAPVATKAEPKKGKKPKDNRVKLQVVYKPPFKLSLRLGRKKNDVSSHLIRDKRPEAVKQRAALFIRADRIRAKAANAVSSSNNPAKVKSEKTKSPTKAKRPAEADRKDTSAAAAAAKVEYKRSMSAPQPEPLYQNTLIEVGGGGREEKHLLEEPQYANFPAGEGKLSINPFCGAPAEGAIERSRVRASGGIKRQMSSDARGSFAKHAASSSRAPASSKRRNSCDAGVANRAVEMLVKRQHSDETDSQSANVKQCDSAELRRGSFQSARVAAGLKNTNSNQSKPVRLKCSYDMETAMVRTPSVTATKSPKRKTSQQDENVFFSNGGRVKERQGSNVRRSMSNNATRSSENDRFKRFSLQHADSTTQHPRYEGGLERMSNVPSAASREAEMACFGQEDSTSEIPSDLEVLLSEVANTGNGG